MTGEWPTRLGFNTEYAKKKANVSKAISKCKTNECIINWLYPLWLSTF